MERNDLIERLRAYPEAYNTAMHLHAHLGIDKFPDINALVIEAADTIASLSEALAEAENKVLEHAAEAVRVLSYKQGTNSPAWIALRQAEDRIRNLPAPPRDLSQGGQHG